MAWLWHSTDHWPPSPGATVTARSRPSVQSQDLVQRQTVLQFHCQWYFLNNLIFDCRNEKLLFGTSNSFQTTAGRRPQIMRQRPWVDINHPTPPTPTDSNLFAVVLRLSVDILDVYVVVYPLSVVYLCLWHHFAPLLWSISAPLCRAFVSLRGRCVSVRSPRVCFEVVVCLCGAVSFVKLQASLGFFSVSSQSIIMWALFQPPWQTFSLHRRIQGQSVCFLATNK